MARPRKVGYEIKARPNGILIDEWYDAKGARHRQSLDTREVAVARAKAKPMFENGIKQVETQVAAPMTMAELFDFCREREWSPRNVRAQASVKSNIKVCSRFIGG